MISNRVSDSSAAIADVDRSGPVRVGESLIFAGGWSVRVLAAVVGAGCTPQTELPGNRFDHSVLGEIRLEGTLENASPAIGQPFLLQLAGGALWVSDISGDPGLHVLDADTGELRYSLGKKGEGPGEFIDYPFGLEVAPGDPDAVWAFDMRAQRLSRFEARPLPDYDIRTISLEGTPRIHRVAWVDTDRIVGTAHSADARFGLFSASGRREGVRMAEHLLGPEDSPLALRLFATDTSVRVCTWPGRGFAIVNFMVGRIEYYDRDANFVRLAEVPFPSEPEFQRDAEGVLRFNPERTWYLDCAANEEHLFALFAGRLSAEFEGAARASGEFVHVFDWTGKLLAVYGLDRDIRPIVVDRSGSVLFAGSLMDSHMYRYELPGLPDG